MAKPKGRPKKSLRDDGVARIDKALLAKARLIVADKRISLAEYLSDFLQGPIERDWAKLIKKTEGGKD